MCVDTIAIEKQQTETEYKMTASGEEKNKGHQKMVRKETDQHATTHGGYRIGHACLPACLLLDVLMAFYRSLDHMEPPKDERALGLIQHVPEQGHSSTMGR